MGHTETEIAGSYKVEVKKALQKACYALEYPFPIAWAVCQAEVGENLTTGEPVQGYGPDLEVGIMQVTPVAMVDMDYFIDETSNLNEQAEAGVRFLKHLRDYYHFGLDDMVRAYNVGPTRAREDLTAGRDYLAVVRSLM